MWTAPVLTPVAESTHGREPDGAPAAADSVRARESPDRAPREQSRRPRVGRRGGGRAVADRGRRLRQLRHAVRARLGRAARARRNAGVRGRDRAHAASARGGRSASCSRRSAAGVIEDVTVALGFARAAGCAWVVYALGALLVRPRRRGARGAAPAHARARPLLRRARVRRHPLPAARARRRCSSSRAGERARAPAGAPVLALLALAGLLRPEAWAFSGLYWLYVVLDTRRARGSLAEPRSRARARRADAAGGVGAAGVDPQRPRDHRRRAVVADEHAPHRAHARPRDRDRATCPSTSRGGSARSCARRCSSAPRSAACCRCCGCAARALTAAGRGRARRCSCSRRSPPPGCRSTRATRSSRRRSCACSAAPACSAGRASRAADPRRRWWMAGGRARARGAARLHARRSIHSAHRELDKLATPAAHQGRPRRARAERHAINLRCGPVGVPNHAPVPLLALYLKTSPANVSAPRSAQIASGTYVDPASKEVEDDYVLDPHDPHLAGERAAGIHRVARQPLVADLQALP